MFAATTLAGLMAPAAASDRLPDAVEPVEASVQSAPVEGEECIAPTPASVPISVQAEPALRDPREAALDAQGRYGGRVLSVRLDNDSYRVKLFKDGAVRVVEVPAR